MADDEEATLEGQFLEFSKFMDPKHRDGTTITLYRSDYWMRQGKILEDKNVTMTDTGLIFFKYSKTEITFDEWYEFLTELCIKKNLKQENIEMSLTNCGIPGTNPANVPKYREYFDTYQPKQKMLD